jgi:DNA-binding beta-propeller fold protein YncE
LAVARALASRARVLVMDEPLVHVDATRIGAYREFAFEWCHRHGISLVIASHAPEMVLRDASHVICLQQGRLAFQGEVDELYERPRSKELAEFLGPVNRFDSEEATVWVGVPLNGAVCVRPERLQVDRCDESQFVVESSRFAGSFAEVDLRHEPSQQRRRVFHRPARNVLKTGDRVVLRILALLLCLFVAGCSGEAGAQLPVSNSRYWQLPPVGASLPAPRKLTVGPDDSIYVLDDAGRVLVYDSTGKLVRRWNMPESTVGNPEAVLVLRDGRVAVADTHYHRVVFFDSSGNVVKMMGKYGTEPEQYVYPVALAEDDEQNLYVCEYGGNDRVQKFTVDGKFLLQFGKQGVNEGEFQRPSGILWHDGKIYVADAFNNRIQVFQEDGSFVEVLGAGNGDLELRYPYDLSLAPDKRLMIVEYDAGRVTCADLQGNVRGRIGSSGGGDRQFWTPWGLAVNSENSVFVADTGNRRVVALELGGTGE